MSQHHRNLGIPIGASKTEIKKAYRKLAMLLHPDKNPDPKAAELFAELQDSYDALMHPAPLNDTTNVNTHTTRSKKQQTPAERTREARKQYAEHMARQKASDERYFQGLMTGKRGIYFKLGWILSAVVCFAILLDVFLPAHHIPDEFHYYSKISDQRGTSAPKISVGTARSEFYIVENAPYFLLSSHPELYIEKTRLLHFPVQLLHPIQGELINYPILSGFWPLLPFPLLMLVIPFILVFYRKRTAYFTALYMISSYVVFPLVLLFLCTEQRWLHLLTLGYY